jgi:hypothetical protein
MITITKAQLLAMNGIVAEEGKATSARRSIWLKE